MENGSYGTYQSLDWELSARKEKYTAAIQKAINKQKFTPSPNLYRSWSIGLYHDAWFRGFTCLVILVQTLGPLFLLGYAGRHYKSTFYVSTWEDFHARYCMALENSTLQNNISGGLKEASDSSKDVANGVSRHGWHPPECDTLYFHHAEFDMLDFFLDDDDTWRLLTQKILGTIFIALIFLSNDRTLLSQDLESDNLSRFFPFHSRKWMFIDALCNSASFVVIGCAIGPILAPAANVSTLVLDAISLLFIGHLDNLGADLDFGVSREDFDYVVDHQRKHFLTEFRETKAVEQEDSEESESSDDRCCSLPALTGPEAIVTVARMLNFAMLCVQLPMYAFTTPVAKNDVKLEGAEKWFGSYDRHLDLWPNWVPWSILIWCIVMFSNVIRFCILPAEKCHIDEKDFEGFVSLVILRRPGSRYQKRVSLESLMHED